MCKMIDTAYPKSTEKPRLDTVYNKVLNIRTLTGHFKKIMILHMSCIK